MNTVFRADHETLDKNDYVKIDLNGRCCLKKTARLQKEMSTLHSKYIFSFQTAFYSKNLLKNAKELKLSPNVYSFNFNLVYCYKITSAQTFKDNERQSRLDF